MLRAQIIYGRRNGKGERILDLVLGDDYGYSSDVARQVLLCVLSARKPVVFDAMGTFYRVPRPRLRSLLVWHE